MASAAPAPERYPVEEKTLFRIGEVSRITNTKTFVLRYWETEFPMLQPVKSPSGHRLYRREDIATVNEIKRLLYDEGFTIVGARKHLGGPAIVTADMHAGADAMSFDGESGQFGSGHIGPGPSELGQSGHAAVNDAGGTFEFSDAGFSQPQAAAYAKPAVARAPATQVVEPQLINKDTLIELRDELRAALTLLEDE